MEDHTRVIKIEGDDEQETHILGGCSQGSLKANAPPLR